MPKNVEMPSDEKAKILLDAAEDRKAVDPILLDLRDKTLMADFFLICSGTSDVHIRAIADSVQERGEIEHMPRPRIVGQSVGEWVLIDFGDVVVHVMGQEPRERYKLEEYWTTPQPHGALQPGPQSMASLDSTERDLENEDWDLDEDDMEDAEFFDLAEQEVEPIDEPDDLEEPGGTGRQTSASK